ncbi:glycosyltransferase [Caldisericum exile]|uniref:Glycosyltransferase n=1 Tax=Caldisericum exile (strain DSM 21853 / NBRC 104410 / AZM16c01) TaxID=511051 RepID=A0A7U6GG16_CALEA|nr:glycosyltransferase [Caldisericum exile]BAL81657.1 putative glycosyltransferase [Caldisericum exile AZM16c01]
MKVLNLIDSLYAGGAESLLKNFLIEVKKHPDIQIDVCTLYSRNVFKDDLVKNGVNVFDLALPFKYDFRGVLKLVKLIGENNYDIVHVHLFPADLFGALASLFVSKKAKFIFSEHSIYNRRRDIKLYKPIDMFVYSRYKKIICVSDLVKKKLIDYIPELADKTTVIKNAIPVKDEIGEQKHKIYDVLFVGRLEKAKGVDVLIKAIYEIKSKYSLNLAVALIGDGSLKSDYEKLVKELNLESSIKFLGIRRDVEALMRMSKIFVLPSLWEGLPMVLLEAMANGIPIIATKVGGIPEVIEDGVNGLLVDQESSTELGEKIVYLLNSSAYGEQLSKNAFGKVKREYSIEAYTKEMLRLYREILNEENN